MSPSTHQRGWHQRVGQDDVRSRLAERLGLPHIELDALHREPDWQEAPDEVMRRRVAAALTAPEWVADGNYAVVRDIVWGRAEADAWLASVPRPPAG